MKTVVRALASVLIAYHLLAIVTFPMTWSIWGRFWDPLLATYGNTLGINVMWQFFSPLPSPTMYIQYNLMSANGYSDGDNEKLGYWPPRDRQGYWRENWQRRSFSMRFFGNDELRMKTTFGAWLCRQNPGTDQVEMTFFMFVPPQMKDMIAGRSFKELGQLQKVRETEWACNREEPTT